jgi:hypothetical protein
MILMPTTLRMGSSRMMIKTIRMVEILRITMMITLRTMIMMRTGIRSEMMCHRRAVALLATASSVLNRTGMITTG